MRCVNNRFLKVTLRAREGFAVLESRIEAVVRERVRRGGVQVALDIAGPLAPASRSLDQTQLAAYLDQLEDFCATHDLPVPKTADALLALPGILVESAPSQEAIDAVWPLVQRALDAAALSLRHSLPMADSLILAAAREHGATVWTLADFRGLQDVRSLGTE
jgi:uncharacterized protein YicC (UPF0701 family)